MEAAICDKDRYSFLFSGLRIESVAGNVSEQRLLVCANRLISTIDYLTENLALIEFDQQNGVVQIRSSKPVPKRMGIIILKSFSLIKIPVLCIDTKSLPANIHAGAYRC